MGKISGWRVLVGGLFAGVILFFGDGFIHMKLLGEAGQGLIKDHILISQDEAKAVGALPIMFVVDVLTGVLVAWLYAAVRPRLGAGLQTAILTGLVVWAILLLQTYIPKAVWMPRFRQSAAVEAVGGVVRFIVAASVAGWVYSEPASGGGRRSR